MENIFTVQLGDGDPQDFFWWSCDECNPNAELDTLADRLFGRPATGAFVGLQTYAFDAGWVSREDGDFCPQCAAKFAKVDPEQEPSAYFEGQGLPDVEMTDGGTMSFEAALSASKLTPEAVAEMATPEMAEETKADAKASLTALGALFKKSR